LLQQQIDNLVLCEFNFYIPDENDFMVKDVNLSYYNDEQISPVKTNWRQEGGNAALYIYSPFFSRNKGWDVEFTLETYSTGIRFGTIDANLSSASIILDRYRQFSPPNVTNGEQLEIKSYSTNLDIFEGKFKANFGLMHNFIIGDAKTQIEKERENKENHRGVLNTQTICKTNKIEKKN
jgi:hypothetical protein